MRIQVNRVNRLRRTGAGKVPMVISSVVRQRRAVGRCGTSRGRTTNPGGARRPLRPRARMTRRGGVSSVIGNERDPFSLAPPLESWKRMGSFPEGVGAVRQPTIIRTGKVPEDR